MQGVSNQPAGDPLPVPERAFFAALILQALEDARRGNADAQDWLDDVGPLWADAIGAVDGVRLRENWRTVELTTGRGPSSAAGGGRGRPFTAAERQRAAYWRRKATRTM